MSELRRHRVRRTVYIADKDTNAGRNVFDCPDDDACQKKVLKSRMWLWGLFQVCCVEDNCPCGGCVLALQFMDHGESPAFYFNILRERFTVAPKYVIYDNACKLKAYALARDPIFFASVLFLIDKLHEPNHVKTCHSSHLLMLFNSHPLLSIINSQACEQFNATVALRAAKIVRWMTLPHATVYMCMFCLLYNAAKAQKRHN